MKENKKNILNNSILKKIILCIISIIIIVSLIITVKKIYDKKVELENSISIEFIEDEKIKEGITKELNRIKKEEYLKIGAIEITVIILCITGIILIIKNKTKK